MKIPTTDRHEEPVHPKNKSRDRQPHHDYKYRNPYHDPFPSDRDLIRPAVFVFVCGALVLAVVAIIFLMMG